MSGADDGPGRFTRNIGRFAMTPESVMDLPGISDKALRLWNVLWLFADRDELTVQRSLATLARKSQTNKHSTIRAIKELEAFGVLQVRRKSAEDVHEVSEYHLVVPILAPVNPAEKVVHQSTTGGAGAHQVVQEGARGGALVRPKSFKETKPETRTPPTPPLRGGDVSGAESVFDAWCEATLDGKRRNAKITATVGRGRAKRTRLQVINAALGEGWQVDELVDAVRGWLHDPFLRGENDRSTVYDGIEVILANGERIEKLRDLQRGDRPMGDGTGLLALFARLEKQAADAPPHIGAGMGRARACKATIHIAKRWPSARWAQGIELGYIEELTKLDAAATRTAIDSFLAEGKAWPPSPAEIVARVAAPVKAAAPDDGHSREYREAVDRYRNTHEPQFLREALLDGLREDEAEEVRRLIVEHDGKVPA